MTRNTRSKICLAVIAAAATTLFTKVSNADVIADWTFETSQPATAGPFSPEIGAGSASGSHALASTYSSPSGNSSAHSFSSNDWSVGDYYEFDVSTVGFSGIQLSFDQTGSATGPKQFKIQYNNGTGWVDLNSTGYNVANTTGTTSSSSTATGTSSGTISATSITWNTSGGANPASSLTFDLSAISGLTGIRIVDNGTAPLGTNSIGTAGTGRVDNVMFTGTAAAAPEPATAGVVAAGAAFMLGRRRRR